MLDIKMIRENPDIVRNDLKKRGQNEKIRLLDKVLVSDKKLRELVVETNELKHHRNVMSDEIARLKKGKKSFEKKVGEMKALNKKIEEMDKKIRELEAEIKFILYRLPNILHESVPKGKDDSENVPIRFWGEKPEFDFKPKDHIDLGLELDLMDIERAAKISGARFYFLKNEAVLLDQALIRFALDFLAKKGFVPIEPPFMIRRRPYEGVTDLMDFEDVLYKIEKEDLYLIATSEHPIAAMYMDEVLNENDLPLKFVGVSTCFRKEAGAHGRDTKGIFRVHQFNKVEQFIFCKPEESWKIHEELIKNTEQIYQLLKIPYRIVNICTGDIGSIAAKKYDLEVWLPGQNKYREVASCSNCTDYQARRLNIRYRKAPGKPSYYVHTLNNTGLADVRTIIAILENYQQKDGSVKIPKVLQPYMNAMKKIEKKQ
jgi:seryl-tRNA synthetase